MADKKSEKVLPPSYVNFPPSPDTASSPTTLDGGGAGKRRYVNIPLKQVSVDHGISQMEANRRGLSLTQSEPSLLQPNGYTDVKLSEGDRQAKASLKLSEGGKDCARCSELGQLLALWELGVSGLARNYSKILSQLTKTRDAALCLESKIRQQAHHTTTGTEASPRSETLSTPSKKVRTSMYDQPNSNESLVNQMYPQSLEESLNNWHSLPPNYAKHITDLNTHLGEAIDLCQQLAAACFKSNNPSESQHSPQDSPRRGSQPLLSQQSAPSFRPSLQSIAEDYQASSPKRKQKLSRQSSAPSSLADSTEVESEADGGGDTKKKVRNGELPSVQIIPATNGTTDVESPVTCTPRSLSNTEQRTPPPFYMMSLMAADEQNDMNGDENSSSDEAGKENSDFGISRDSFISRGSVLSHASTFSDSDVKQVMSKIAGLEDERVKLLETIDVLHIGNQQVRLSLVETMGDLENKDLQLTLAMQDLSIATDEIKMAASMRRQMESLSTEREALLERLSALEDESAAVKVSLIQLLQEKSATNKTLALENWRLSQRMRSVGSQGSLRRGSGTRLGSTGSGKGDGDNISVHSNFSTADDVAVQEAVMQLDDPGNFVHKQGFLIKQGARVKTWKKRLFVLDSEGLSYFKTEQPIQTLPLNNICEVQLCHGRTPFPNMFEVHTPGRIFYLSAQSQDDMQSWVGMLQTLKQWSSRARQPGFATFPNTSQSVAPSQAPAAAAVATQRPLSDPSLDAKLLKSPLPSVDEDDYNEDEEDDTETSVAKSVPLSSLFSEEEQAVLANPKLLLAAKVGTL